MSVDSRVSAPAREILIVEDNPADVCLLRMALGERASLYSLHIAGDGLKALRFLYGTSDGIPRCPHLVLLDLNLPCISGHDVLKAIKSDPRTRIVPVIAMSSSESYADINRAYQVHANCYVTKPVDLDNYIRVINLLANFWLQTATLRFSA